MPELKPYNTITVVDGADGSVDLNYGIKNYYVSGTETLTSNWSINASGTAVSGMECKFYYDAAVTLGGNHVYIFSSLIPDDYALKEYNVTARYNGSAWVIKVMPDFQEADIIITSHIKDDAVTAAKILGAPTGSLVGTTDTQTLTNKSLVDASTYFIDDVDATKKLDMSLGGATTSKKMTVISSHTLDRSLTLPDATDTLVGKATIDTLTNKTLTTPVITTPDIDGGTIDGATIATSDVTVGAGKTLDVSAGTIKINENVAITSTSTEVNLLDGLTLTTADLEAVKGFDGIASVTANELTIATGKTFDITDVGGLYINNVSITASAAEINRLTGVTPGTITASKAVVVNSDTNIGVIKATSLYVGATGAEAQITSTPAELNFLDGSTAGTAVASTALVCDASKDIDLAGGDLVATLLTGTLQTASQTNITAVGTIATGVWNATDVAVTAGGTGASTAGAARTNLGLVIGTDVQAYHANLAAIAGATWTGAASITTLGTIGTGVWQGTALATSYVADSAITEPKLGYTVASNVYKGAVCIQTIDSASLKTVLTGLTNIFPVKEEDVLLYIVVNLETVCTAACTLIVGLDAAARGGVADTNGLLTAYAVNGGVPRAVNSSNANIGTDQAKGYYVVQADGYLTATPSVDISTDATFTASMSLFYIPK